MLRSVMEELCLLLCYLRCKQDIKPHNYHLLADSLQYYNILE